MSRTPEIPTLAEIEAARARIAGAVLRSPLVPLNAEAGSAAIHLKLENLQPIGSFKLRGALNALRLASRDALAQGVYTASAGNMAQGLAWSAREVGIPCAAVVPDNAPETKLRAVERLGGRIIKVSFAEWWRVMEEHRYAGLPGLFVHPVSNPAVIAGHATIGLEILEDLPDVEAILVPYGGGGLSAGIAAAIRACRPEVKVYACEVETAAPLQASLAAGAPRSIDRMPSFVDGIGGQSVLAEMWPLARRLLDGSFAVSVSMAADAVRLLAERNRVIAEGAGAVPVAAALAGHAGAGRVACVISGGNIDSGVLATILRGETP